jgi:bacillithiol system protein YtxJ
MAIVPLRLSSVDDLVAQPGRTVIYKHSPTCSLCGWSEHVLGRFAKEENVELQLVDVFKDRAFSQAIEATFGVRHESPQILIIEDGKVLWHASHRGVAPDRVRAALSGSLEGLGSRM